VDTKKAFGLPGGLFNVSALNIHGQNLSADNLGTLNTASGIEAQDTTRLWELWYQQSFLNNKMDVKVGQQSIDQEFIGSQSAGLFVNTMFGWPALPSYDMPSGGPAYPLADLGVRVRGQITPTLTALAGVFDGDPLGNNPNNISGTNFNLHTSALYIGELQYALNQPGDGEMVGAGNTGLPGSYKLGFWYNTGSFADEYYDNTGCAASRRLQFLRRGRPDGVAPGSGRAAQHQCVRPGDGRTGRPQPRRLLRQPRRSDEGAVRRTRQRHRGPRTDLHQGQQ
jgi:porin